ncbi:MerR family DNA-binding transcriptional regulator [Actinoallomurus oryzae]|uniref:MerR family DNA-binding transcriptional regulator n=1 Tax=Actinoallomurus oryzae TaxID=502180 RepID=UPI0031F0BEC6
MSGETRLCSIGEAARRTGLTTKTVRLYSNMGLVPPTDRRTPNAAASSTRSGTRSARAWTSPRTPNGG